jgi:hypothetical protein
MSSWLGLVEMQKEPKVLFIPSQESLTDDDGGVFATIG